MSDSNARASPNLGFLTVLHEAGGYLGGYLVTNVWGRPLEFRLSTAVQPNRVQQILYGDTLESYVCADLIGKTLVDKTTTPAQMLLTDTEAALDLRQRLDVPVFRLAPANQAVSERAVRRGGDGTAALEYHPGFPADADAARQLLDRLDGGLDLAEPFGRIREAIAEARRLGVTSRN